MALPRCVACVRTTLNRQNEPPVDVAADGPPASASSLKAKGPDGSAKPAVEVTQSAPRVRGAFHYRPDPQSPEKPTPPVKAKALTSKPKKTHGP